MVLDLEGGASAYGFGDMQHGPLSTDKEDIFLLRIVILFSNIIIFWNLSLNIILL